MKKFIIMLAMVSFSMSAQAGIVKKALVVGGAVVAGKAIAKQHKKNKYQNIHQQNKYQNIHQQNMVQQQVAPTPYIPEFQYYVQQQY